MKSALNFAEILSQISDSDDSDLSSFSNFKKSETDFSSGWESSLEPFGLSDLLAKTAVYKKSTARYKNTFVRPSHPLNAEQKQAFETLSQWAPQLKNNFTAVELRSSYRAALLKTHPDHGGTSEIFWAAKKSYEMLRSFVTSKV